MAQELLINDCYKYFLSLFVRNIYIADIGKKSVLLKNQTFFRYIFKIPNDFQLLNISVAPRPFTDFSSP